MYAWGWNSLENSAETVQLCLRMRSQKNTSFMFLHKTLKNTSWIPCFGAENFNLPGWHWTFGKGEACAAVDREHPNVTRPRGAREEETGAHERHFIRGVTRCMEAASNFPDKERGKMGLKKPWRQNWGKRVEGQRRKHGQEVTWIQAKESLSSGLVTSKCQRVCVCVCVCVYPSALGEWALTATSSSLPSLLLTSLLSLRFSLSSPEELLLSPSGDIPPHQKGGGIKIQRHCCNSSHWER